MNAGEFDNAGAMMSIDESLMCSFQACAICVLFYYRYSFLTQVLRPAEKKSKTTFGGATSIGVGICTGNGCDVDVGFGSLGVKAIVVGLAVVGLESTNLKVASLFEASITTS